MQIKRINHLFIIGLGPLVTGLQVFAFLFMILSTAGSVHYIFCTNGEDYSCGEKCFHCMFCFYPFAGNITFTERKCLQLIYNMRLYYSLMKVNYSIFVTLFVLHKNTK